MLEFIFWFLVFIVIYTYLGYTLLLFLVKYFKSKLSGPLPQLRTYEPEITILIAAYNEKNIIPGKVENLRQLDYPKEKLHFLWVTDGSNDGTNEILSAYPDMQVLHENERKGKIGAINRAMAFVKTPITVFCDANNFLSTDAIKEITRLFADEKVGCVAGEKQIIISDTETATGSGEGIYWRYESLIKHLESDISTTIGAAGEIFSIRTNLYQPVEPDTILDDFIISLRIAEKGYKIKYAHKAIAVETCSATISDEMKRKIRIAAGGTQTLFRLKGLLNPFKHKWLSLQYYSHKVFRWTIVPLSFILLLILNILLVNTNQSIVYQVFLYLQLLFYFSVILGLIFRNVSTKLRFLFMPYYLAIMNLSILLGMIRYLKGNQSVNWDKAKRK